jgi:hypothetical protein
MRSQLDEVIVESMDNSLRRELTHVLDTIADPKQDQRVHHVS